MSQGEGDSSGASGPSESGPIQWQKVLETDELEEGRVRPVTCNQTTLCLTRHQGEYGALDGALARALGHVGPSLVEIVADPALI